MALSKGDRSIKFFNILGEPLITYDKVPNLIAFKWRPRPKDILKLRDIEGLKKTYKTKYLKSFKEEEKTEKSKVSDVVK
jgi:hypothetical protein